MKQEYSVRGGPPHRIESEEQVSSHDVDDPAETGATRGHWESGGKREGGGRVGLRAGLGFAGGRGTGNRKEIANPGPGSPLSLSWLDPRRSGEERGMLVSASRHPSLALRSHGA